MKVDLVVEPPPIAAALCHGAGEPALEHFRNAAGLEALLRLNGVRRATHALVDPDAAAQLDAITAWAVALPAVEARAVFEEPALRGWLGDAERVVDGDPDAAPLRDLALRLPWILAPRLREIEARRHWRAVMPPHARAAPIGADFRLRAPDGRDAAIELAVDDELVVTGSDARARLGWNPAGELILHEALGFQPLARRRVLPWIEVFTTEDYPELLQSCRDANIPLVPAGAEIEARVREALGFLVEAWPDALPDIVAMFRGVLALEVPNNRILSSSSPGTPLVIQLTVRPGEGKVLLAESIVHEIAHVKLDLLWRIGPLLHDDGNPRWRHPWRPDPRPMRGVLLGAHAFANVLCMYQEALARDIAAATALSEIDARRRELHEALAVLAAHAQLTPNGAALFAGLCTLADYRP